jgi:hypothetical protein
VRELRGKVVVLAVNVFAALGKVAFQAPQIRGAMFRPSVVLLESPGAASKARAMALSDVDQLWTQQARVGGFVSESAHSCDASDEAGRASHQATVGRCTAMRKFSR